MTDKKFDHHGVGDNSSGDHPNETMRLLLERASLRNFSDKKIEEDVLENILNAGVHAATGGNLQPWSIIKIEDKAVNEKLGEMCWQSYVGKAPVNLLFCMDWRRLERWAELQGAPFTAKDSFRHFWISFQDTLIAAQNICTAADAMGLGSVYIGTIMEYIPESREMFDLPDGVFPVVLLCLGYPEKGMAAPRKKLGIDVVVHNEKYKDLPDEELLKAYDEKYDYSLKDIDDESLERFEMVCRECHGQEFADEMVALVKEKGGFNRAQNYFGLHYVANGMADGNDTFLQHFKDAGFKWFEKWEKAE